MILHATYSLVVWGVIILNNRNYLTLTPFLSVLTIFLFFGLKSTHSTPLGTQVAERNRLCLRILDTSISYEDLTSALVHEKLPDLNRPLTESQLNSLNAIRSYQSSTANHTPKSFSEALTEIKTLVNLRGIFEEIIPKDIKERDFLLNLIDTYEDWIFYTEDHRQFRSWLFNNELEKILKLIYNKRALIASPSYKPTSYYSSENIERVLAELDLQASKIELILHKDTEVPISFFDYYRLSLGAMLSFALEYRLEMGHERLVTHYAERLQSPLKFPHATLSAPTSRDLSISFFSFLVPLAVKPYWVTDMPRSFDGLVNLFDPAVVFSHDQNHADSNGVVGYHTDYVIEHLHSILQWVELFKEVKEKSLEFSSPDSELRPHEFMSATLLWIFYIGHDHLKESPIFQVRSLHKGLTPSRKAQVVDRLQNNNDLYMDVEAEKQNLAINTTMDWLKEAVLKYKPIPISTVRD